MEEEKRTDIQIGEGRKEAIMGGKRGEKRREED